MPGKGEGSARNELGDGEQRQRARRPCYPSASRSASSPTPSSSSRLCSSRAGQPDGPAARRGDASRWTEAAAAVAGAWALPFDIVDTDEDVSDGVTAIAGADAARKPLPASRRDPPASAADARAHSRSSRRPTRAGCSAARPSRAASAQSDWYDGRCAHHECPASGSPRSSSAATQMAPSRGVSMGMLPRIS